MMELLTTIHFKALEELEQVATQLLDLGAVTPVWLFDGHMGAGKTTLIKAICRKLGVQSNIHSPTFSLVNEYDADGEPVYHFDFYRIKDETEALDMGVEEYLDSGSFCFIEWPEKIIHLWPEHYLFLHLEADEHGMRILEVKKV